MSAINPGTMNIGSTKKHHRCLTCCIVCLVIWIVFTAAIIGGSAFAFNKFVSPMIGGVGFWDAIRLMHGVYSGERQRDKILTNTYTEEDLSDFYDELNMHMFQQVRSNDSLKAEFAAMDADAKAAVLVELQANKKWNAQYEGASDKEAVLESYYVSANRYPITIAKILSAVDIEGLTNSAAMDDAQRDVLDEYLSTDPVARVAAAGDSEEESEDTALLQKLLSELHFDFQDSGLLGKFVYTEDENYASNVESVTFTITGNQIAALVGEVVSQVLSNVDLGSKMGSLDEIGLDISKIYLPDYVLIPQVVIEHKTALPNDPTQEQLDEYNKNTYASVTLEMRIRKLLENEAVVGAVKSNLGSAVPSQFAGFIDVGWNVVKAILPKTLFVTVGVYPLDSERETFIKINNYNDHLQQQLAKVINAVAGDVSIFDTDTVGEETAGGSKDRSLLNQVNAKVNDVFASLEEQGIPLSFVDVAENQSVGLRLAHVQMLLQFMNAYDPQGIDGITPYMFMTVLKCLFSNPTMITPDSGDLDALYAEIESKYGVSTSFWDGSSLLDTEKLDGITSNIDLKGIDLRDNETMRVNLQDRQLLALFVRAKEDGSINKLIDSSSSSVAAASDEGESESSVNDVIKGLNFSLMQIKKVDNVNVYGLSIRATLSIANVLGQALEDEQSILKTLTDAIPNSLSLGITVYIHVDADGHITYVGADEDGKYETDFLVNAFDETYTKRVIDTISILLKCLGKSEGVDTKTLGDKISSAFQKVFDTIKDTLYCQVGVKDGTLVLPSLYEVVQGFSKKKIEETPSLTQEDLLQPEEIRDVLNTMYHSTYSPASYTGTPGDDMLGELQSKYYLAEAWTAADLFGGETDLSSKLNADSINFRDPVDGEGNPILDDNDDPVRGLYHDTRTLGELRVNISGDALADLLTQSGKLDAIGGGEGDSNMIKSLTAVNCTYTVTGGATYANFIFLAQLTEDDGGVAPAGDADAFGMDSLLPDRIYLTARILMHREDGDYSAEPRYTTSVVVNDRAATTDNMFKLIKVFSGEEFDKTKVTNQVSDNVSAAFEQIEEHVNLLYGNAEKPLQLDNVFNTINKISNKPTDEDRANPDYVPYESNVADDAALQAQLREFGRDPAATTSSVTLADTTTQTVVSAVDVAAYASVFHITGASSAPNKDDESTFFATLNRNYYIADGKEITAEKVNSGTLAVDSELISLKKLYADTTPYSQLATSASDRQIAALIASLYPDGIEVKNGEEIMGVATILAVHIDTTYMKTFVRMAVNESNANAKLLPKTIYLESYTWLVDPVDDDSNPLLDDNGNPRAKYYTTIRINDLTNGDTEDLFGRLKKLSESMSLSFNLELADVTKPIEDNLSDLFEDKLSVLGNVVYSDGSLDFPTIFAYLTDGKLVTGDGGKKTYDTSVYMVDIELADPDAYYASHTAATDPNKTNPQSLMNNLREFGRNPSATTSTVTLADTSTQDVISWVDVEAYTAVFGITNAATAPNKDDESAFFGDLNRNYYIAAGKEIDTASINAGNIVVDETFISLAALYQDTRPYGDLTTYATDNRLAAVISAMYASGIEVKNGLDVIGTAYILAVHISTTTMKTFVKVEMNSVGANADKLPEVIYITSETWLVDPDGTGPRVQYETSVVINDMVKNDQKDETSLLFVRLDSLSNNIGFDFDLKLDAITAPIQENIQSVFETKLSRLGNIYYENGRMVIPSLFAYLTDGKLVKDGDDNSVYDKTQYMVDIDISGIADYYDINMYPTHTAADDVNKTDPENLMYRMRELGKAQYAAEFASNMYIWDNGRPATSGARYNDNVFTAADEEAFYDQLQALYFFNDANRPSSAWFIDGAGDKFTSLTGGDLSTTFNVSGYSTHSFTGNLAAYANAGLYNYNGSQYGAILTDKAMGSLMKTLGGDVMNISASSIQSVEVTSVKLSWNKTASVLTIEITVLVTAKDTATALPSAFYMTTVTERDTSVDPNNPVYNTKMTLNRFAMDSSFVDKDGDLSIFLNNLSHISLLDIKSQLDTDSICNSVTDALEKVLDERLAGYIVPFEDYTSDVDGAIEFYDIYHQIADKMDIDRTIYTQADDNIQSIIYKLHNVNSYIDQCNEYVDEIPYLDGISYVTTDRAFARLAEIYISGQKAYVTKAKSIFFVGTSTGDLYADWQDIIQASTGESTFAFGGTYILMTLRVDLSAAAIGTTSVSLLPSDIYVTMMIDVDNGNAIVGTYFINDFTKTESDLLKSKITNSTNLDLKTYIDNAVNTYLSGVTFSKNPDDPAFADYVGKAST